MPSCGHTIEIKCSVDPLHFEKSRKIDQGCYVKCGALLDCGHECAEKCCDCRPKYFHGKCEEKCSRKLLCGHNCDDYC